MITNITLENFKCFRRVSIDPKLLTVLIGPNGTGKSSILQSLLLLKHMEADNERKLVSQYVNEAPIFLSQPAQCNIDITTDNSVEPFDSRKAALKRLTHVSPARGLVRGVYQLEGERTEHISTQSGFDCQEEQTASSLACNRSSEESLSKLLMRITGTGLRADAVPPKSVEINSLTPSGPVNIVAEGFGANALALLLHQLISAENGATVLIEEPESHLHPKAQAEVAEVLADAAKTEGKQIILTTHSEYVAGRLLTLVAEGKLTTDELAIFAFEKDEQGECSAMEIEVTERGQVKGSLTGFHEATRDEMRRYVAALQKKRATERMTSRYILDENVVIFAQRGLNEYDQPDVVCRELFDKIADLAPYSFIVDDVLWEKYDDQLNNPAHYHSQEGAYVMIKLWDSLQVSGKIDGLGHVAPPFPEEGSIPQGSQDDVFIVRLAVEEAEKGTALVTADAPLRSDLAASSIQTRYALNVLSPKALSPPSDVPYRAGNARPMTSRASSSGMLLATAQGAVSASTAAGSPSRTCFLYWSSYSMPRARPTMVR